MHRNEYIHTTMYTYISMCSSKCSRAYYYVCVNDTMYIAHRTYVYLTHVHCTLYSVQCTHSTVHTHKHTYEIKVLYSTPRAT